MKGLTSTRWMIAGLLCLALIGTVSLAQARVLQATLGTAFTYQGRLTDDGAPANGTYDLTFALYNDPTAGVQVGGTVTKDDVSVNDGLFTVTLDFGNVFDRTALYLEIGVRPGSDTGAYTTLAPRQPLTASPYASYALKAPWNGLIGVPTGFADGVDNDTTYTAGTGLTLSGAQFSLSTPYRLPQNCANGQVARWDVTASAWTCAVGGDITAVNAGTGLTGGGDSGDVTLRADTQYLQRRVTGACPPGQYLKAINEDGSLVCEGPAMYTTATFCQQSIGDDRGTCSASCPIGQGYVRTGGGCESEYVEYLIESRPNSDGAGGWTCSYYDMAPVHAWWIKAYVICLQP